MIMLNYTLDTIERNLSEAKLLNRETIQKKDRWYEIGRRVQDILFSSLALIVLSPFMLLVAVIIYIDSPGASPIFSQTRVGLMGKEFKFYKFRSMCPDAEKKLESLLQYNDEVVCQTAKQIVAAVSGIEE